MSRHGKYAAGKTRITFLVSTELRDALKELAEADERTLSLYLARTMKQIVARKSRGKPVRPPRPAAKEGRQSGDSKATISRTSAAA